MGNRTSGKKIIKLSGLLVVREVWGLLCNLYLLIYQPFLTLRTIKANKDKSQTGLIIMVALLPLIAYSVARLITDYLWYGTLLNSVGIVFSTVLLIELFVFGYLFYWTVMVLIKNRKSRFVKE